jgi:transposase
VTDVVKDLKGRFALRRIVFVGDRGMLSDLNLEGLIDEQLGFIVAHPLRRNHHATEVIGSLGLKFDRDSLKEQFLEERRQAFRFVVAYSPKIAREVKAGRDERLNKADAWTEEQLQKLVFPGARGRKPTPQGTYDRIRDYLRDRNLLGLYDVALVDGSVHVTKDRSALLWESKIDGMLMVETTDTLLSPEEVIHPYKELAEIERGWRCLKSTLLLRPVYHWTERRIRAHIFVCVLALQVERWMRRKMKDVSSVPKAIRSLQRIKVGEIEVGGKTTRAVSRSIPEQKILLETLGVPPLPLSI